MHKNSRLSTPRILHIWCYERFWCMRARRSFNHRLIRGFHCVGASYLGELLPYPFFNTVYVLLNIPSQQFITHELMHSWKALSGMCNQSSFCFLLYIGDVLSLPCSVSYWRRGVDNRYNPTMFDWSPCFSFYMTTICLQWCSRSYWQMLERIIEYTLKTGGGRDVRYYNGTICWNIEYSWICSCYHCDSVRDCNDC